MTKKAADVITALFESFMDDPRILPDEARHHYREMGERHGEDGHARSIADYIAGMTDRYAIVEYERIHNPRQLSFASLIP